MAEANVFRATFLKHVVDPVFDSVEEFDVCQSVFRPCCDASCGVNGDPSHERMEMDDGVNLTFDGAYPVDGYAPFVVRAPKVPTIDRVDPVMELSFGYSDVDWFGKCEVTIPVPSVSRKEM